MRRHGRGAMALGIAYMSTSKGNGPGPPWGLPLFRQSALYCHVDIGSRQAVHVGTWGLKRWGDEALEVTGDSTGVYPDGFGFDPEGAS